ncbi:MAG: HD domain-containing phosphohydrolase [Candidatus Omnitrophota bacterium]
MEWEEYLKKIAEAKVKPIVYAINQKLKDLSQKDSYTNAHCSAVSKYAFFLSLRFKLSQKDRRKLALAGRVHDLGKLIFPDKLFSYNDKLEEGDWKWIHRHPEEGFMIVYNLLNVMLGSDMTPEKLDWLILVLYHHWRYDENGKDRAYPKKLLEEETKEFCKKFKPKITLVLNKKQNGEKKDKDIDTWRVLIGILHAVDSIDAVTSSVRRPMGKEPGKIATIIDEIKTQKGTNYHPDVAEKVWEIGPRRWEEFKTEMGIP